MQLQFENFAVLWGLVGVAAWIAFQTAIRLYRPESASWRRAILSSLAFLFVLLALARPQLGRSMMQKRSLKGNLFIAIDVSKSMSAEDVLPSRIGFAVAFAQKLVKKLTGTKFALFPFAETGYVMMPLTSDTNVADEMLSVLGPGITTNQGTNLSGALEALFTSIKRMEAFAIEHGENWAPTQVIVLSDGESHTAMSSSLMSYYRAEHIPVFTVVTGTKAGAQISVESEASPGQYRVPSAQRVTTKASPETLDEISRATGGELFPSELATADRAAQKITQAMAMGRLTATFKVEREFYPVLLLLALACLTLDLILGRWRSALRKTSMAVLAFTLLATPSAMAEARGQNENSERRAVEAYNQALILMEGKDTKKALELFQESATITKDKTLKKKGLLALGNAYLKMMEPQQAVQNYQLAHDLNSGDKKFDAEANRRLSENIALAMDVQAQMNQMSKDEQEKQQQGEGKGKEPKDSKGPQRDYDNQPFSEGEKEKMYDLMGTEDQGIQARLMQEKAKKEGKTGSGKPW